MSCLNPLMSIKNIKYLSCVKTRQANLRVVRFFVMIILINTLSSQILISRVHISMFNSCLGSFRSPLCDSFPNFAILKRPSQILIFYELVLKKVTRHGAIARVCSKTFFVEEIEGNRGKNDIRRKRRSGPFVEELFVKSQLSYTRYIVIDLNPPQTWQRIAPCRPMASFQSTFQAQHIPNSRCQPFRSMSAQNKSE